MTKITKSVFDKMPDGREVYAYTFADGDKSMKVHFFGRDYTEPRPSR